jgi:hypothetical protein
VAGRSASQVVQELVGALGEGKVILSRCESPSALALGLKNGISLFQGRFLDSMRTTRRKAGPGR